MLVEEITVEGGHLRCPDCGKGIMETNLYPENRRGERVYSCDEHSERNRYKGKTVDEIEHLRWHKRAEFSNCKYCEAED